MLSRGNRYKAGNLLLKHLQSFSHDFSLTYSYKDKGLAQQRIAGYELLEVLLQVGARYLQLPDSWPPQWCDFSSTGGASGTTAGAAAPLVNMLEEALRDGKSGI